MVLQSVKDVVRQLHIIVRLIIGNKVRVVEQSFDLYSVCRSREVIQVKEIQVMHNAMIILSPNKKIVHKLIFIMHYEPGCTLYIQ